MGLIIIIPLAALAGWSIFAIARWLRRGKFDRQWWKAYAILAGIGLLVGIWFAFFLKYRVANTRLEGFPIPESISTLMPDQPNQKGGWMKSDIPLLIRWAALATNLLSGAALCLAPLAVAAFFKENRIQRDANGNPIIKHL